MKKLLCLFITIFLFCSAVSVFAATKDKKISGIGFSTDSTYTVMTEKNLQASSEVEGLVFVIISPDNRHQIQARCTETVFSKQLGSFDGLEGTDLAPVGNILFPDGYDTSSIGSHVYLKSVRATAEGYTVIYTTVTDKKLYTFTYFGPDPTKIGEFIATVTLPSAVLKDRGNPIITVVLILLMLLVIIAVALIILSFVKDHRRRRMRKNDNIVSNYIKIKRRKY